jgi:hypothetical protein
LEKYKVVYLYFSYNDFGNFEKCSEIFQKYIIKIPKYFLINPRPPKKFLRVLRGEGGGLGGTVGSLIFGRPSAALPPRPSKITLYDSPRPVLQGYSARLV